MILRRLARSLKRGPLKRGRRYFLDAEKIPPSPFLPVLPADVFDDAVQDHGVDSSCSIALNSACVCPLVSRSRLKCRIAHSRWLRR